MKVRNVTVLVGVGLVGSATWAQDRYRACLLVAPEPTPGTICSTPSPAFVPQSGLGGPAADGSYVGVVCDRDIGLARVDCGGTIAIDFLTAAISIRGYNSHGDVLYAFDRPGPPGISNGIWLGNGTRLTHTILGEGSGAINDRRRVVATSDTSSPDFPDGIQDIITFRDYSPDGGISPSTTIVSDKNAAGGCAVFALNERSLALIRFDGQRHLWDPNNGIRVFDAVPEAVKLNNHGSVLGRSALWRQDGTIVTIPTVPGRGGSIFATGLNDDETVIGRQNDTQAFAFVWTVADGSRDLNTLLPDPNAVPHLETAWELNARGQIVAEDVDGLLWLVSPCSPRVNCGVTCPGDADADNDVDLDDLVLLLANFGQPFPAADFDGDGTVDLDDLLATLHTFDEFYCAT